LKYSNTIINVVCVHIVLLRCQDFESRSMAMFSTVFLHACMPPPLSQAWLNSSCVFRRHFNSQVATTCRPNIDRTCPVSGSVLAFVFFPNSNFVGRMRISLKLCLGVSLFRLIVRVQYFIQHGYHVMCSILEPGCNLGTGKSPGGQTKCVNC